MNMKSFTKSTTAALFSTFAMVCGADAAPQAMSAKMAEDHIAVMVGDEVFTTYKFGTEHKYPFFHPVVGPKSGETLTTWDQEPFPHHSSIYISLDRVRCDTVQHANYWQPRHDLTTGQVFSRKPEIVSQQDGKVVLRDKAEWIVPPCGTHHFTDVRTVTISAPSPEIRLMDFQFDLTPQKDLVVGQTGHSFFSARMRPELAVGCERLGAKWAPLGTGTIIDSLGGRNEEDTREKAADWAATFGQINGHTEGVAIIQHSENPNSPAKWFIRNYGFMSPTPFAFDGNTPMKAGETWTFRYRVVVFSGDPETADIAAWHKDFDTAAAKAED